MRPKKIQLPKTSKMLRSIVAQQRHRAGDAATARNADERAAVTARPRINDAAAASARPGAAMTRPRIDEAARLRRAPPSLSNSTTPVKKLLEISSIRRDARAQPRTGLLVELIAEYRDDMARGDRFPAVIVFEDDDGIFLADGFHRCEAAEGAGISKIEALVYPGGLRDAVLYSCGANAAHGTRRSNADKRKAVTKLLEDEEWSRWSDREIAEQCHVGNRFVGDLRRELVTVSGHSDNSTTQQRTYRNRHGGVSRMRTGNIGRHRRARGSSASRHQARPNVEDDPAAALFLKLKAAVKVMKAAEREFMSTKKAVGLALREVKERHPADFVSFVRRVRGLDPTRAFECLKEAR